MAADHGLCYCDFRVSSNCHKLIEDCLALWADRAAEQQGSSSAWALIFFSSFFFFFPVENRRKCWKLSWLLLIAWCLTKWEPLVCVCSVPLAGAGSHDSGQQPVLCLQRIPALFPSCREVWSCWGVRHSDGWTRCAARQFSYPVCIWKRFKAHFRRRIRNKKSES